MGAQSPAQYMPLSYPWRSLHKDYLTIMHALYFAWDAIMRVQWRIQGENPDMTSPSNLATDFGPLPKKK